VLLLLPNKDIDQTAVSNVRSPLIVKVQNYYSHYYTVIPIILSIILIISKDQSHQTVIRVNIPSYCMEAGHHYSSSGTINVPCTLEDAAADAGPTA
jgi:hypothetical protein